MSKTPGRILVVDDIEQNIQVLGSTLSQAGYDVFFAQSGLEALVITSEEELDLILLDIMMPGMNGLDVAEKLKFNEETKDIPIIFISALSDKDQIVRGFEFGGVDYVTKPFNQHELLARVQTQISLVQTRKNLERKNHDLENLTKDLQDARDAQDRFMSIMAHDLKNPFNGLISLLTVIREDYEQMETQEILEILDNLLGSSKSVYGLLLNLLDWGRSQSGSLTMKKDYLPLGILWDQIRGVVETQAQAKGIQILSQGLDVISIVADKAMIETVLRNLISNAVKFTPKGGEVKVLGNQDQRGVVVEVCDKGVGMSEAQKQKLFRLGEKVSTRGTEMEKGTGLGLLLVKEFVEKNDGKLEVESQLNQGSVFRLVFPLVKPELKMENPGEIQ